MFVDLFQSQITANTTMNLFRETIDFFQEHRIGNIGMRNFSM